MSHLVTCTEEILNGKNFFFCAVTRFRIRLWIRYLTLPVVGHYSWIPNFVNKFFRIAVHIKGATKSYFTHYSFVVFIFLNTGLCMSAFSTNSFRKLLFLSSCAFCLFRLLCVEFDVIFIIFIIAQSLFGHVICVFVPTYEKQFVNNIKMWVQFLIKNMPLKSFWTFKF